MAVARRFIATDAGLTPEMRGAFDSDGYLLIEDFVPAALCDLLIARANELVTEVDIEAHGTVFSTKSVAHAADRYFRESGGAIHFFLEEEAVDSNGRLTHPKELAVNKLGHAMHDLVRSSRHSRVNRGLPSWQKACSVILCCCNQCISLSSRALGAKCRGIRIQLFFIPNR